MSPLTHKLYINTLILIVLGTTIYLFYIGFDYYALPLEERFYHKNHHNLKPSGFFGHGLGIIGTLLILIGVFGYMARKRIRMFSRIGVLKYWLEFHIFLCVLGPVMILFHTAFKFGGIVSISFWSMVAVVASGVLGRFIYLQIPRTKQGRELSLQEIKDMQNKIQEDLSANATLVPIFEWTNEIYGIEQARITNPVQYLNVLWRETRNSKLLTAKLKEENIPVENIRQIISHVKHERSLHRKIDGLKTMQKYFRYWHIAHLPFAIIMLIIMIVHVVVAVTFGYTWIF